MLFCTMYHLSCACHFALCIICACHFAPCILCVPFCTVYCVSCACHFAPCILCVPFCTVYHLCVPFCTVHLVRAILHRVLCACHFAYCILCMPFCTVYHLCVPFCTVYCVRAILHRVLCACQSAAAALEAFCQWYGRFATKKCVAAGGRVRFYLIMATFSFYCSVTDDACITTGTLPFTDSFFQQAALRNSSLPFFAINNVSSPH